MRKPRSEIVIPGRAVHLMQRGNNRRRIFSYPPEYRRFLHLVGSAASKFECLIWALCLMANHIHMVVKPPSVGALSLFVKWYGERYARYRNERRDGSGKLFEERFRSPPIGSESQLIATILYIERNPIEAGMKAHPGDYNWSSYRLHANRSDSKLPSGLWTPSPWYLGLGSTAESRAAAFEQAYASYDESKLGKAQRKIIEQVERASQPYSRRLERPNRTSAREPGADWQDESES